jgi:hypothetical protein
MVRKHDHMKRREKSGDGVPFIDVRFKRDGH